MAHVDNSADVAVDEKPDPASALRPSTVDKAPALAPGSGGKRTGDKVFSGFSTAAGISILILLASVFTFLLISSGNVLITPGDELAEQVGFARGKTFWQFAGVTVFGTLLAALIALVIAVPFAVGIALFISHFAPRKLASGLGYVIDLLAAIPSVVFGLWGMWTLEPLMRPIFTWISSVLTPVFKFLSGAPIKESGEVVGWEGGLPGLKYAAQNWDWWPLAHDAAQFVPPARNILMGGVILAIMILPIITSLAREVFLQTPRLQEEASLALGATRWEMIKMVVIPHGRSGIVSASMLGLGRALGETMALLMVLSPGLEINFKLMSPGQHSTIASQIALRFPEASGIESDFLIALGLILFVITFVVNFIARAIVARYAEFSGANA
ncbi:PstC family ABC transporter permease [Trueperella bialowiezensis]|uniref:Phosphate transport system permease protein pstC n=1 Tax=Trueperella bialowiezensis TaxID=312285 RepID=A0A448PF80_9ACTO|nr:ABC transporter permease subunit [Trueperella bialowiezensis]VEI13605.1 Phosphate transport system permease protein pstC [Trueperella bialowiezensis]